MHRFNKQGQPYTTALWQAMNAKVNFEYLKEVLRKIERQVIELSKKYEEVKPK